MVHGFCSYMRRNVFIRMIIMDTLERFLEYLRELEIQLDMEELSRQGTVVH